MKKSLFVIVSVLIVSVIFTACKKEGVYNPTKRIKRIYKEEQNSREVYDQETGTWQTQYEWELEKQPVEVWEWDNKQLKSITAYSDYEFWCKTFFFYDKKQLSKVVVSFDANNANVDENSSDCWMYFNYKYDQGKLSSIQGYDAEGNVYLDVTITHSGSHISKVTLKGTFKDLPEKNKENLLPFVCSHIISPFVGENMSKCHLDLKKIKGEYWYIYDYALEWNGDNIQKVMITASDSEDEAVITITDYSYDNQMNPYYGSFMSYEAGNPDGFFGYVMPTSKNNLIYEAIDNWSQTEYSYEYREAFPTKQTKRTVDTYGPEERSCWNTITYFEYE